jgi:putative Mg2+ transporter-C (MgtC) family protein
MSELELALRLIIAVVLGSLIGLERELARRPAGLRTHALVCLGACLFTAVSVYSFSMDAKIAAAIVTGIGFIGAGNIIATRGQIRGITTAASLWAVAGVGIAVGVGSYVLSTVATFLAIVILQFRRLEKPQRAYRRKGPIF